MQRFNLTIIAAVAAIGLSACDGAGRLNIGQGTYPWETEEIEIAARKYIGARYPIESVHVTPDFTGRTNRITGFNAWVEVVGCSGAIDLAYDEAGILQRENNTLKC